MAFVLRTARLENAPVLPGTAANRAKGIAGNEVDLSNRNKRFVGLMCPGSLSAMPTSAGGKSDPQPQVALKARIKMLVFPKVLV
jgi:hypothetical protein